MEAEQEDITPSMISDEEEAGNDTFCVHSQEWRSEEMTALFKELDRRADAVMKRAHPRKNRVVYRNSVKSWCSMYNLKSG